MKLELLVAILTVSVLIGCTRKSDLELRTEEYDVIEEGTADGWPNDLGATQVAPLTDTNLDTTTSFSILGTDVPADSTALPEDPALAGRLGGAITTAPAPGPVGAPPSRQASASRAPSAAADAPPPSRPAEPPRRETPPPPASAMPAPVPREPAPTTTRQAEPAEEPAPQPEPTPEPAPEPVPEPEPEPTPEPEPPPPTTTRTETAPPPEPTEPEPDPPPSDDASPEDSAARR